MNSVSDRDMAPEAISSFFDAVGADERWAARQMRKLTDTERHVAELVARGRRNHEIATRFT